MPNRRHTLILVRSGGSEIARWDVTGRRVASWLGGAAAIAGLAALSGWLWLAARSDRVELSKLRNENESLRTANETFETRLSGLQERLADSEDRTRKLAIVAGVESLGGSREPGVGGVLKSGSALEGTFGSLEERSASLSQSLDRVESKVAENFQLLSSSPSIWPVGGLLSSGFGYRRDPLTGQRAFHDGVDISASPGRPVLASASGVVAKVLQYGGLGRAVYIAHGFGITTVYGHMSRVLVKPGQRIERGDSVGLVGNTGRSTGYHLHYEVQLEGSAVNPLPYLLGTARPRL
ncbi:MAG TPA: peptidoglycan DD-metalloendopeptidase family protein [Thermoanaerobaculia bacterium]|nr:peptidoglycan DD-metalloendopeptidase family protein [Thermoanaerobaculia bacterium]